jgi:hypothetical protein
MEPVKVLTLDDLISAFIEYHRHQSSHKNLSGYYKKRLELLQALFHCDIENRQKELDKEYQKRRKAGNMEQNEVLYEVNGTLTFDFLNICIRLADQPLDPFKVFLDGLLVGIPPKIEKDLRKKYETKVKGYENKLNLMYRTMIQEVLIYLFPGIETKGGATVFPYWKFRQY